MEFLEIILFFVGIFFTFKGFGKYYYVMLSEWPPNRNRGGKFLLSITPLINLIIIVFVLRVMASFDVVNDFFYLLLYLFLGFMWLLVGMWCMTRFLNLSWRDDALENNNASALFAIVGGMIGLTLIYSGANIGDGPGFWCVILAGGIGFISWFILGIVFHWFTQIIDRITIERDTAAGIRFGFFLIASGLIFGRGVAGDWTSFPKTIEEFSASWPVLVLFVFAIIIEILFHPKNHGDMEPREQKSPVLMSFLWGIIYLLLAIICLYIVPPLPQNPIYDLHVFFLGGLR